MRFCIVLAAILLAGCGGSSGGLIAPKVPLAPQAAGEFAPSARLYKIKDLELAAAKPKDLDFSKNYSLPRGWAGAISGVGLVAGIIDSGVDFNIAPGLGGYYKYAAASNLADLATRLSGQNLEHFEYINPYLSDEISCKNGQINGSCIHGALVAATINQELANAKFVNIMAAASELDDVQIAASVDAASANGVRFFNRSFGSINDEYLPDENDYLLAAKYRNAIIVSAAGNEEDNHQITTNALPKDSPLRAGWIIALGYANEASAADVDDFYIQTPIGKAYVYPRGNSCKQLGAKDCLSAPFTTLVNSKELDKLLGSSGTRQLAGTSFSTPLILSAAMGVYAKYPWMSNDNIKETLFSTAYKVRSESGADTHKYFGEGILNAAAAMNGPAEFRHDFEADVSSGLSVFSNDISGDAGLIKLGAGTLALVGNNTFSGKLVNTEGTLWLSGENLADVGNFATLRLSGARVGKLYNEGELISEGFSANLLALDAKSKLFINAGDSILIDGKAQLDGSLEIVGLKNGYLPSGEKFRTTVLQANQISGEFKDILSHSAFLKVLKSEYKNDSLELSLQASNQLNERSDIDYYAAKNYESLFKQFDYLAQAKAAAQEASIEALEDISKPSSASKAAAKKTASALNFAKFAQQLSMQDALALAPVLFANDALVSAASDFGVVRALLNLSDFRPGANLKGFFFATKAAGSKRDIVGSQISFSKENAYLNASASLIAGSKSSQSEPFFAAMAALSSLNEPGINHASKLIYADLNNGKKAYALELSGWYKQPFSEHFSASAKASAAFIRLNSPASDFGATKVDAKRANFTSQSLLGELEYEASRLKASFAAGVRLNNQTDYEINGTLAGAQITNKTEISKRFSTLLKSELNYSLNQQLALNLSAQSELNGHDFINQFSLGFNYQF